jgi:hypothetical protein
MDGSGSAARSLYEADEHAWMLAQLALLEQGRLADLDVEHLREYLRDMTIRDRRALRSRLAQLWLHILKFQAQPELASRSWRVSVLKQQFAVREALSDTPSLARYLPELGPDAYAKARQMAAAETGLAETAFPAEPPMTLPQALAWVPPEQDAAGRA